MGKVRRAVGVALLLGLAGMTGAGCGDDENNQGVSFRAVGIFQGEESDGECTVPNADLAIADAGISFPLDGLLFGFDVVQGGFPNSSLGFSICRAYIQLTNDLINQSINVERIDFEYEIPGSRIAVPMNSMPTGFRINPSNADPDTAGAPLGLVNTIFVQPDRQLVPSSLIQFLRQNEPSLPQVPYVMIVHITAHGRTDTGDTLVSNELRYTIELTS